MTVMTALPDPKLHPYPKHWSLAAALCSEQLIHCASLHQPNSQPKRQRRMTPFWRGVSSLRPIGASCKDDGECITMRCRKSHCSLRTSRE
ncbi:liver-expressed antimicrobial peptide 2 isoform X1 [Alligator mississippiensis]|uniref:liver-expressed antimicrobial peptide 2 isoform X1 n=1 Tax=Alligator mississippiensis TaxID=8496 RepID=UPI000906F6BE|nr:liver-expressed antimicrobial peptide 2 isoform X1 [Alligator mississippiensis]XP_059589517.1 liver-expressed antimicrobial peptide 2 isoform X1 [Alligator mississippiensis]